MSEEEAKEKNAFQELAKSIKDAATDRKVGLFLLAFFFYIDGVYTIIDMATAYGTSLGLDTVGLLAALLVTQLVAFPSAIIIGRLSRTHEARNIILVCIIAYFFL
ncbi:MAG: MFS transporter [Clostridia bacterium]|nr:MFS transporter [Clostridia bacterium]